MGTWQKAFYSEQVPQGLRRTPKQSESEQRDRGGDTKEKQKRVENTKTLQIQTTRKKDEATAKKAKQYNFIGLCAVVSFKAPTGPALLATASAAIFAMRLYEDKQSNGGLGALLARRRLRLFNCLVLLCPVPSPPELYFTLRVVHYLCLPQQVQRPPRQQQRLVPQQHCSMRGTSNTRRGKRGATVGEEADATV